MKSKLSKQYLVWSDYLVNVNYYYAISQNSPGCLQMALLENFSFLLVEIFIPRVCMNCPKIYPVT